VLGHYSVVLKAGDYVSDPRLGILKLSRSPFA
jgi:hypothetical protein